MDVQILAIAAGMLVLGFLVGRFSARGGAGTVTTTTAKRGRRSSTGADTAADASIESHVRAGRKIEAIKVHREAYRTGLKEAKDAVDAIEVRLGGR